MTYTRGSRLTLFSRASPMIIQLLHLQPKHGRRTALYRHHIESCPRCIWVAAVRRLKPFFEQEGHANLLPCVEGTRPPPTLTSRQRNYHRRLHSHSLLTLPVASRLFCGHGPTLTRYSVHSGFWQGSHPESRWVHGRAQPHRTSNDMERIRPFAFVSKQTTRRRTRRFRLAVYIRRRR